MSADGGGGRAYRITGTVLDAHGDPVPGVAVAIADGPGPFPDIAALTGADGRFSLSVSTEGVYTVQGTAADGRSARASVEVSAGGTPPASAELRLG
ncbi:carboxypeptidase-like regulatory domain-containing protein [Streptomyces sp. NPDC002073]|uniref:carboxypeptidase-like regulatory domain-containing protein n=1 Tax=Streptomyces sp. NBC_00239 TaxID=2903640 RepID=UPI002E2E7C9C|nr:carboxypeptidase-like regulatory domain-containing protein [Streptomyces sp. NBC_00239]